MNISIIIAMYNAEKYLRECLDSVIACPDLDIECILVNDGSTDATGDICNEYANCDSRFKVIHKSNSGVSDSRNVGLESATGRYVFFLDSDDFINEKQWPLILSHAESAKNDFVAFAYESLYSSGNKKKELYPIDKAAAGIEKIRYIMLATPMLNTCWGKLFRRDIIANHGLRFKKGLKTCEDAIFVIDFVQAANTFMLSNECILVYRLNDNGAMNTTNVFNKLKDFNELYLRRNEYLSSCSNAELYSAAYRQFFSVITDLLMRQAHGMGLSELRALYAEIKSKDPIPDILAHVDKSKLASVFKRLEFDWFKRGRYLLLACYFKFKNLLA